MRYQQGVDRDIQEREIDTGSADSNAGTIAAWTISCVAVAGAAIGVGYAYKTGRIGQRNRPEQYGVDTSPV